MSNKESLEVALLKAQFLINSLTYLSMDKSLENDALKARVHTKFKELIKETALGEKVELGVL